MDSSTQSSQIEEKRDLRTQFFYMSIVFAIGHGTATTPLVYASSLLDPQVAYACNGTLYILMLLSSLLFAVPVIGTTGLKGGLVAGLALYGVYAGSFSLAAMSTTPFVQGVFFIPGSICGGIAAGLLWTAQGGYLTHCGTAISEQEKQPRELVNSQLATQFAFWYLLFEVLSKILWSLSMMVGFSVPTIGTVYVGLAVVSCCLMCRVGDVQNTQSEKSESLKCMAAFRLWPDVRIWLLSPTNITFGIAAAYMNGYFNANIAAKVLGVDAIGYLSALTVLTSCTMTWVYGGLSQSFGNLVPITIGAVSFAGISLLVLFFCTKGCQDWGWWLIVFYVLQGSGRSVFENANKAVFADTFKGADAEGAFANSVLQLGASSAICFLMSTIVAGWQLAMAVLIFAILMPTLFMVKMYLDPAENAEAHPLLASQAAPERSA